MSVEESIDFGYRAMRSRVITYLSWRRQGVVVREEDTQQFQQFRKDMREHLWALRSLKVSPKVVDK